MKIRILEEDLQLNSELIDKDFEIKRKISNGLKLNTILNRKLNKKDDNLTKSYYLSDGKLGCFYLDENYFFICFGVIKSGKIQNALYISHLSKQDNLFYATRFPLYLDSPMEVRNLIKLISKKPEMASKLVRFRKDKKG